VRGRGETEANVILGIGVDIAQIERMRALLERHGDRVLARILTDGERAYCAAKADAAPHVAARFAAKEATAKAFGTGISRGVAWKDIEVRRDGGAPRIELAGGAARVAADLGVTRIHLSLSHDGGAAVAMVVLEGD